MQGIAREREREREVFKRLAEGSHYKFLGVMENTKQDDDLSLQIAGKAYLQRLSLIWSSPLSDYNKVQASNEFAMPVLSYLMPTQCWPVVELSEEIGQRSKEGYR